MATNTSKPLTKRIIFLLAAAILYLMIPQNATMPMPEEAVFPFSLLSLSQIARVFAFRQWIAMDLILFTAGGFEGTPIDCNEGVLEWVEKDQISELNLWEGDRIFFRLLEEQKEFFSLKLVYNKQDILEQAVLDAKELELFDILNEDGSKTGVVKERGVAHREGALHGTVHIWIVRENDKSGYDVLLQKRSDNKDSYPGCYDISSAGHISAGDGVMESALREFEEELGLSAQPEQLELFGTTLVKFETTFSGKIFRDNEFSNDFVYRQPVDIGKLKLQESEVAEVCWMDYEECREKIADVEIPNCINPEEFEKLGSYLGIC
jgi:8-oxo-dGTP diphosphatase